ncbi:MAG: aminotransferase class V-fold PLP-dependent enzyme [Pseudomonadota bacterium]
MSRAYLDFNATAPLRPEARDAMLEASVLIGNPSSVHAEGRAAKAAVERARAQVAEAVGCQTPEVVFTSGATEAASVLAHIPGTISVEETAHDAVWAHRRDATGPVTRAIGVANSETGLVAEDASKGSADVLMLDATQAIGRIPWAFSWSGADLAILSAHKLGGPKGIGALIVRRGFDVPALQVGGGQEMGRRSGTENIAAIAGFGAAAKAAMADLENGTWDRVAELRNILETRLAETARDAIFVGAGAKRLPNTSCVIVPGWKGETQVMQMDLAGYAISSGSACSSGKVRESRVLRALGFDDAAASSAIRISMGPQTTKDEIMGFAAAWSHQYEKFRARAA